VLVRDLEKNGIADHSLLACLSDDGFNALISKVGPAHWEIVDVFRNGFTPFSFFRLLLASPQRQTSSRLHATLDVATSLSAVFRRAGPTPSENMRILSQAQSEGWNINAICDQVVHARVGCAVADSTRKTYASHLLQIERSCKLLSACGLPATLQTIRRVTSIVNDPSTLRGWLAAWRILHISARIPWAGDHDPALLAIRTGLHKQLGPAPVRRRCRKGLLRKVLYLAARRHLWEVGAFMVTAYTVGLRVPSELLKQASAGKFDISTPGQLSYGPMHRKGAR
jgi:hypothetical protein